jgi:RNA polymerase sigma-70 factor (ECF subfamily)
MDHEAIADHLSTGRSFDDVWAGDRGYLLGFASRMLGNQPEAEDVVQEAFSRLALVELGEIDDVRGWLAVVVRRLCLDRIRSAHARREFVAGAAFLDGQAPLRGQPVVDPAERVTLDDQVQLALAIVLDKLTPAERTAFVLHDVFGFSFAAVGEIVGRTPAACRQLASRARRSIRSGAGKARPDPEITTQRVLTERFIAACAGGDITELMAVLDPDVDGEAILIGRGPFVQLSGRPAVAQKLLGLFGSGSDRLLVPVAIEDHHGVVAFEHGRVAAVILLDEADGRIRHIHTFVRGPAKRKAGRFTA